MDINLFPVFFQNCILVKGSKFAILTDIQRGNYLNFPIEYVNLLKSFKRKTIKEILSTNKKIKEEVLGLIEMLIEKEYLFLTKNPEFFPEMNLVWDYYSTITNAIIDVNPTTNINKKILEQLILLGCIQIQIRSFKQVSNEKLKEIIEKTSKINSISFEIIIPWVNNLNINDLKESILKNNNISKIVFHSSKVNKEILLDRLNNKKIVFIKNKLAPISCGIVNSKYFANNIPHFTEAQHHNTCLNRKISIDAEGNIKNCPSMKESFGNIKDTTLEEALNKPGFKKYWDIKKDDITKCKDCEFRYICTDCRAYLEDPDDIYSAPLKCGYDPYTGKWEEWSKNPLKEKAIRYYGMEDFLNE